MIATGNFFFRWRDTAFSVIFLGAFILVCFPGKDIPPLPFELPKITITHEIIISVAGFLTALAGQIVRAVTIGYAYIKRGGLNKKIYAETLVRRGMFAHSRNPLYLGNLLIVTGGIISLNLFWYWLIALPLFYFIYYSIIFAEEKFLSSKFGEEYQVYLKEVNRLLPGGPDSWKKSIEGMEFTFKRLINKEHGSIFVVFTTLALYNVLKFHYRYNLAWDSPAAIALFSVAGALLVFQITAAVMKRTGRLTWDPERP